MRGRGPAIITAAQGCDDWKDPCVSDGTGLAEALLGLDGFRVLEVTETPAELVITVETTADLVSCSTYGTRAESQAGCRWRSGTCLLGAAGSAGVGQAPVAVPRAAVCGEDVDGALGSPRCAGGAVRRPLDGPPLGAPWERYSGFWRSTRGSSGLSTSAVRSTKTASDQELHLVRLWRRRRESNPGRGLCRFRGGRSWVSPHIRYRTSGPDSHAGERRRTAAVAGLARG